MGSDVSKATTQLIEDNQGLVYSIAMKIFRRLPVRYELDDLVGYGMVGLSEAAKAYKPSRGTEFSTFAYYRIQGSIYDGISEASWMSRARYRRLIKQKQAQEQSVDSEEDSDHESESSANAASSDFIPSMQPLSDAEQDTLEDQSENPNLAASRNETNESLCLLVDRLPPIKSRLITMVYFDGQTLQFAADRLGISKSWASRLHASTLTELARELKSFAD